MGEPHGCGRGVNLWSLGAPEVEAEIGLLSASNHGDAVGHLEPNRLSAGVEEGGVQEPAADEINLGPRVQQHK